MDFFLQTEDDGNEMLFIFVSPPNTRYSCLKTHSASESAFLGNNTLLFISFNCDERELIKPEYFIFRIGLVNGNKCNVTKYIIFVQIICYFDSNGSRMGCFQPDNVPFKINTFVNWLIAYNISLFRE